MLRYHFQTGYIDEKGNKVEGLSPWIYNELKSIAALSYKYDDEGDVTDIVEEIAGELSGLIFIVYIKRTDSTKQLTDSDLVIQRSCVRGTIFRTNACLMAIHCFSMTLWKTPL